MQKPNELTAANLQLDFDVQLTPGSIKSAMKDAGAGSRDLWQVPPDELRFIDNFNVRVNGEKHRAKVREYADSMKSEGYYQHKPLAGYVAKEGDSQVIYITDGHTRLQAVLLAISEGAEIELVPVVVSQAGVSMEDLTVALVRSNSGEPLAPIEIGAVCKRLVRYGWDEKKIGDRLGITEQYVKNLLSLIAAPIEIREMVMQDRVSASTAIEVIAKHGSNALDVLEKAQERARASGKGRATAKHVDPSSEFKKAVRDRSGDMFVMLEKVASIKVADGDVLEVSDDLFSEIYTLVQEIKEKQPMAS